MNNKDACKETLYLNPPAPKKTKYLSVSIFFMAIFVISTLCHARVFFAGSNPQMTVFAFPQDLWLIPKDFVFYQTTYQAQPWWGDIDQPDLRPSTTYLLTGEKIGVKGSPDYFKHEASLYNWKNMAGFTKTISPLLKTRFDLEYAYMPLSAKAEGAMADSIDTLHFNYTEEHSIHNVYLTSYLAILWRSIPIGFKLGFGRQSALEPNLEWNINKNGTNYTSARNVWAWSTLQGGKIFGNYPGLAYARFQDDYTVGSLYQFDLQTSATLSKLKLGGRFRYDTGELEQFRWQNDTNPAIGDSTIWQNFAGSYQNTVAKKIGEKTFRVYGNYNWIKQEKFLFNTLVLSRYTVNDSTGVLPQNSNVESGVHERAGTFVFQVNPNVNIYPWDNKFTYIDLAILCNYSHMSYDYTRPYWVGGGQKDGYVNTTVSLGEDYSWYDCSYARQNFFEIAFDANPTFPIYGDPKQSVAMSVSLLLWTRFKWLEKYYGETHTTSNDINFEVKNIRKNFEREVWLNSVLNIIYRRNTYVFRLTFGQPLTYSLTPVTRVYDNSGRTLLSEVWHENMWVSQAGAQIGFFVSTSLDNLFGRSGLDGKKESAK